MVLSESNRKLSSVYFVINALVIWEIDYNITIETIYVKCRNKAYLCCSITFERAKIVHTNFCDL